MQQSQSITPSQTAQVTQASVQAVFKPKLPGADTQPDLSHLTPEERMIIEDVINRQRQEELIDRSQGKLPLPTVVQRGSKVFQRLPTLPDTLPSSSGSAGAAVSTRNAQSANSLGRAKDEFFGGVTRRGRLIADRPFPCVQHNRTSGDLFGAVSSFFTRTGGGGGGGSTGPTDTGGGGGDSDVCEICQVTKFTSNAGHNCAQCNLKTCVRCGGWIGNQSSWMCKNCFSNLSAPPHSGAGGVKDVQRSTVSRSLATTDQPAKADEIPSHSQHNPVSSAPPTSSTHSHPTPSSSSAAIGNLTNVPPTVECSQSGYAGIAGRTRLREAMRDHRSISEEERVWSQYQPTPSSHAHPSSQQHGRLPPANYYSSHPHPHTMRHQSYSTTGVSTTMAPRYLQQHSSHYPPSITYNQLPPPPPHYRHSTGPPSGSRSNRRGFCEEGSWMHPSFPPPLTVERHAFRPSDGGGGTGTTSCGSAEGSPRTGFHTAYLRRNPGGGQMDPGSVSEPCQSEAVLRGDHHKSLTAEGRMYQHSFDVDRPISSRSVFWSPSEDGESLVGQVYLRKSRASSEIGLLSSFGLKLVIGKRVPSDMVGTFVSSVKERSVADLMGELQTGDEILEWNGHNLRGLHQEEVSGILALSRNTDEIWLTVQRVLDDFYGESDGATSTSFSRHDIGEDTKFQDEEEEEYDDAVDRGDADPHLQLKLRYDEGKQDLIVSVLAARDLPPQLNTKTWLCNSFCQITILPETSKYEPRCTRVARNTNDPVWIHNFTFDNFVLSGKELEVAVFDYRQGRTAFIGEVLINLQVADISGRAYWYPIPPPWDATDQDISSQVQSESGTFEPDDWSGETSERGTGQGQQRLERGSEARSLRNISPRSVPSQLSSAVRQRRQKMEGEPRKSRKGTRASAQPAPPRTHPLDRGTRFTLSEDDQSFLSDNSEASEFSSFSKLSLQSNRQCQRHRQRLNTVSAKLGPTGGARHISPRISRSRPDCRSPPHGLLAETGEEEEGDDEQAGGIESGRTDLDFDKRKSNRGKEERTGLDDQTKSSSTEEKSISSSTPAGVSARIAPSIASAPATDIGSSSGAPKSPTALSNSAAARKRRSSIGHRFSNVLGISKKNTAASGGDKKTKASFQRSEEVLPAYIHTNEKATVSGGYKAPGIVAEGAGFGGIAASSAQSAGGICGAQGSHYGAGLQHQLSTNLHSSGGSGRKDLALEIGEVHVGEFVEGLGPGQLVGRQVLGMPCLGEIQLSFFDRKGHLEVEVIRARGLQQKNTSKPLPTPYVKLHLLEGKQSIEKMRTTAPARRTLDPLFQQQFSFSNSYKDKILQVSVWGEYGRMDKKVFLGMCEIVLDDLNLRSIVFGWYKLFGMIAATAQHHKQVRKHTGSTGPSGGGISSNPSSSSAAKQRTSKIRSPQDKS